MKYKKTDDELPSHPHECIVTDLWDIRVALFMDGSWYIKVPAENHRYDLVPLDIEPILWCHTMEAIPELDHNGKPMLYDK